MATHFASRGPSYPACAAATAGLVALCALIARAARATPASARTATARARHQTQPTAATATAPRSPLAGMKWYVDPNSDAAEQSTWQSTDPSAAGEMAKLAARPTAAFLWIKTPGRSDGTCSGGPPAGTWWPSYAPALAQRAAS
jgi:hypothetical protein